MLSLTDGTKLWMTLLLAPIFAVVGLFLTCVTGEWDWMGIKVWFCLEEFLVLGLSLMREKGKPLPLSVPMLMRT